jgi:hypothetical protein
MPLVVENGTGLANADSLVSATDMNAYAAARGINAWPQSPAESDAKDAALRRATSVVLGRYRGRWSGEKTHGRAQALDWPRKNATDADGAQIADDEIPVELEQAVMEAAWREYQTPNVLSPDETATQQVKRTRQKLGPLETETEYADNPSAVESAVPILTSIDDILAPLLIREDTTRTAYLMRA